MFTSVIDLLSPSISSSPATSSPPGLANKSKHYNVHTLAYISDTAKVIKFMLTSQSINFLQ